MPFRVYHHADVYAHPVRPGHPERPHRVAAMLQGLAALEHEAIEFKLAPLAPLEAALLLHDESYIEELARPFEPGERFRKLDRETIQAPDSLDSALGTVGALFEAVDDTVAGKIEGSLAVCRPAGHHACRSNAMGFCMIGPAALAAKHAELAHGKRVAVLDFDVHHGNGTEDLLWHEEGIFFASTHQGTAWPGSGRADTVGRHGQIMNRPLPSFSSGKAMREAWSEIFDRVRQFAPDLIVVSAGFDAHVRDPLENLRWTRAEYEWLGQQIHALAGEICAGRVVHLLEGGYDLWALQNDAPAYFRPFIDAARPRAADAHALPQLIGPSQGGNPTPYLIGNHPIVARSSGKYAVVKAAQRLWLQNQETGNLIYTPPNFVKKNSQKPLVEMAERVEAQGFLDIEDIIEFETVTPRYGMS